MRSPKAYDAPRPPVQTPQALSTDHPPRPRYFLDFTRSTMALSAACASALNHTSVMCE